QVRDCRGREGRRVGEGSRPAKGRRCGSQGEEQAHGPGGGERWKGGRQAKKRQAQGASRRRAEPRRVKRLGDEAFQRRSRATVRRVVAYLEGGESQMPLVREGQRRVGLGAEGAGDGFGS